VSGVASFLADMARASRRRVRQARAREPEGHLLARALGSEPPPDLRLAEFDVIAELKLKSPAAGALTPSDFDGSRQVAAYAAGGAAAVSVLTEPASFNGELAHLEKASELLNAHGIPTMRKDFLTDPYQVLEARAAGAGGVLVILTMLNDAEVRGLLDCARECGLFVLLEAFDHEDLARVAGLGIDTREPATLIGVNCRDLKTLQVDFARFDQLREHLPRGLRAVAESGIDDAEDVRAVAGLGYRVALIGSALMRSTAPERTLARLVAAGRLAATGARSRPCS
jgi:indole-3-glycerol phosphate synthase